MLHGRDWSWTMFDRHHFEVWIPGTTFQTYLFSKLNWIHNLHISSNLNKPAHRFILFLSQLSYCLRPSWSFCTGIVTLWVRWIVIYYYGSPMIWFVHISKMAFKSGTLRLLLLPLPNSTHQNLQCIRPFFFFFTEYQHSLVAKLATKMAFCLKLKRRNGRHITTPLIPSDS